MKLEIRSSDDQNRCPECGATKLIFAPSSNEALEYELADLIAKHEERFVGELRRLAEERLNEEVEKRDHQHQQELDRFEAEVKALLGPERAASYQVFKQRWLANLREDIDFVTRELRRKTA